MQEIWPQDAAALFMKKAELIEGVVHMPSPVRMNRHAEPHVSIVTWLGTYRALTPGVRAGDPTAPTLAIDFVLEFGLRNRTGVLNAALLTRTDRGGHILCVVRNVSPLR